MAATTTASIDLLATGEAARSTDVYKTTVAIFKEEQDRPRVLADSEHYLAYSLKNGRTIRLISRAHNVKGSLRAHNKPIHAIKFVNFRSNVGASAAENEFFVWVVSEDRDAAGEPALAVKIYFQLQDQVTIRNFAFFINTEVHMPDLLILYDKKAAVLESNKLIQRFEAEALQASLATDSKELRELTAETTAGSLCSIDNNGWFAFTADAHLAVACTLLNRTTPPWAACRGAAIVGLELLDGSSGAAQLVVSSGTTLFHWRLAGEGEPVLLRTMTCGPSIVTIRSSRNVLAVFNSEKKVALVELDGGNEVKTAVYEVQVQVRASSVCFHHTSSYSSMLVDAVAQIDMYQLSSLDNNNNNNNNSNAEAAGAKAGSPTAKVATPTTTTTSTGAKDALGRPAVSTPSDIMAFDTAILSAKEAAPAAAAVAGSSSSSPSTGAGGETSSALSNLMMHLQRSQQQQQKQQLQQQQQQQQATVPPPTTTASYSAAPGAAPILPAGTSAAFQAARAVLQNQSLPQFMDGPVAAATYQSDEQVRRELEGLQNRLKNAQQIIELTPDQMHRDYQQLLDLALEAQMTELQRAGVTAGGAAAAGTRLTPDARANLESYNSYAIVSLLAPVAQDIAKGVTHGIRDVLRTELDGAVRHALGDQVRDAQKQILKQRLDEAVSESTDFFIEEVRRRLDQFANREMKETFAQMNASLNKLVEDNRRLQVALRELLAVRAMEQVSDAREQLRALRADLAASPALAGHVGAGVVGGSASAFAGNAHPTPETVFSTASRLVGEHKLREAIEYLALGGQPQVTIKVFEHLPEDSYSSLMADEQVADETWVRLLLQLTGRGALEKGAESPEALPQLTQKTAEYVFDVLSEREEILSGHTAEVQQLRSDIRHFLVGAKQIVTEPSGQRTIKNLEKIIK